MKTTSIVIVLVSIVVVGVAFFSFIYFCPPRGVSYDDETDDDASEDDSVYTPGIRCQVHKECQLPGTVCNKSVYLCDYDPKLKLDEPKVSPLACYSLSSPLIPMVKEKCDNIHDTGSSISQTERDKIADFVNEFRTMINNNCTLGLGVPKPVSNYRKVKYSCDLEKEAKFECSQNLTTPEYFKSDEQTWRSSAGKMRCCRQAIFHRYNPSANKLMITPDNQTVKNDDDKAVFIRLFMSEDVTEVGCFVQSCGEYEYIACKSNHNHSLPNDTPLYTPGQRCNANENCTLPGYPFCDTSLGLCDYKPLATRRMEALSSKCNGLRNIYIERKTEKCNPGGYDTGSEISNKEREIIVYTVNHYRQLINNGCNFGKGNVKSISNYRKVKYSCALELEAAIHFLEDDDPYALRYIQNTDSIYRRTTFTNGVPYKRVMMIDPANQTSSAGGNIQNYTRFMLSPDVTEIGCFIKVVENKEHMVCRTGHIVVAPKEVPLYTPGRRCLVDQDCTLPGYPRCEVESGLCDEELEEVSLCSGSTTSQFMPLYTERCENAYHTGSDISQAERNKIVDFVNEYRTLINNNCTLNLGALKPASNYRKVKYSCDLEQEAKFECSQNFTTPEHFVSKEQTWRRFGPKNDPKHRQAVFHRFRPFARELKIDPDNQTILNDDDKKVFITLFMSEDVTEVGCYVKYCGEYEYIACRSNHNRTLPNNVPLYIPGQRCNVDNDCTLQGYPFCDTRLGLCDYKSYTTRRMHAFTSKCDDVENVLIKRQAEKCNPGGFDTGNAISYKEREAIVHIINHYRKLVNSGCDFGKGILKPVSNYRKVKYSCLFEEDVKFDCSSLKTEFNSDKSVLRLAALVSNDSRLSVFQYWAPYKKNMLIDPNNLTIAATELDSNFVRFMLPPAVTKIGCFVKVCGEYEYMACKTGHAVVAPKTKPLYTPGKRCTVDTDCTIPGYTRCDADSGLCDEELQNSNTVSTRRIDSKCDDVQSVLIKREKEKCNPGEFYTGSAISNTEREIIVHTVNHYRQLLNNHCDFGKGIIKPVSNYRKVKYSCAFEADVKFHCSDIKPKWKSDRYILRLAATSLKYSRLSVFQYWAPYKKNMLIDPNNQTIAATEFDSNFVRFMLSPDMTKIGCFVKVCSEYEYMACKTDDVAVASKDKPLYTPGNRCMADTDCTIPGYTRCDANSGLCDLDLEKDKPKVSPLACYTLEGPKIRLIKEKCDNIHDTGSDISQAERSKIVDFVNEYRTMINNNCTFGLGVLKPASNYRKVKYSCDLEKKAQFECGPELTPGAFTSDAQTWRSYGSNPVNRVALFQRVDYYVHQLLIDPDNQTVVDDGEIAVFVKLFMSDDVTEVGCYVKLCGDKEFIACKSNHDRALPSNAPLYTPGKRCNIDADCTLPGYPTCDVRLGLCDYQSQLEIKKKIIASKCDDVRHVFIELKGEKCSPNYNTGSNISVTEREIIVHTVNHYRKLINNNCDLGNGIVKPVTNYRKVKYSCALEEEVIFGCSDVELKWESDKFILRASVKAYTEKRWAIFVHWAPWKKNMLIDPNSQTSTAGKDNREFLRLMLSPDVTEIGCFIQVCGKYEYMACKTGHVVVAPKDTPLYTPGNRCIADDDCTLPDYGICDIDSGLCEES